MNKLKMGRMKSNAINQLLGRFRPVIFSIADQRVAHCGKLRADLILQSRHQFNPDERCIRKKAFDGVMKFGASRLGITRRAQPLKHAFTSKIVHERSGPRVETAPQYGQILPERSMRKKLTHEHVPVGTGFRKEQSSGGKTIDAMYDKGPLPLAFQLRGKQRQSRRSIRALDRYCQKSGRFVENDRGIVFVKHGKRQGKTRPAQVFVGRAPIRSSCTASNLSRKSFHWQNAWWIPWPAVIFSGNRQTSSSHYQPFR